MNFNAVFVLTVLFRTILFTRHTLLHGVGNPTATCTGTPLWMFFWDALNSNAVLRNILFGSFLKTDYWIGITEIEY
jgi:hypothetical protein